MEPEPTGRVLRTGDQSYQLILTRGFPVPPADIWSALTDPAQAAAWFGRWEGHPARNSSFDLQMLYEEGLPWSRVQVRDCAAPELLRLLVGDDDGAWDLEIQLQDAAGGTRMEFIQHLADPAAAGSYGPGWEYYLDRLKAALNGTPAPEFGDYYPAQGPYFEEQARTALGAGYAG
ncbi:MULTISPECIES: SRPBCC domain-containing protein [unclassified Arthrobacter]|uniref:SRPBCC domain-containing protein n=1 Tax=unclassified Arthrobacter TaxID=235627 RepID=UPI001D13BA5A|nr:MULTISPECIES: SRPBCC domain-containing protein [unclassified Arthrobacter]MCC3278889.1 SRPBCC domain-containing protein [Arthrobacter sp. zg-Y40]MCC9177267.1 SRPBCC domain-containing protein [Arthrobacter sp. zg-Y750]MDK1326039.1 SRPBCC domain-containing protein [Arthrobacter sp. zg-Y1143]